MTTCSFRKSLRSSIGGGIPLLSALYMLQGLSFGLITGSLPLLLSGEGIASSAHSTEGYRGATWLAFACLPYGLKLLWAPIVDTVFLRHIGRRRSWILPCNLIAGLSWFKLSTSLDVLVSQASSSSISSQVEQDAALLELTIWLFIIVFVMSVQDVAVDGWALTVEPRLLPASSLAQTLGMTLGNCFTNAGVICARTEACVAALGATLISFRTVGIFISFSHMFVSFVVMIFTTEEEGIDTECPVLCPDQDVSPQHLLSHQHNKKLSQKEASALVGISASQRRGVSCWELTLLLGSMWKKQHVRTLVVLLLCSRVAFALTESNTLPAVEFVRAGGNMKSLVFVIAFQYPIQGVMGFFLSRWLGSSTGNPLKLWKQSHTALLALNLVIPIATLFVSTLVGPTSSDVSSWLGTFVLGLIMGASNTVNKAYFIAIGTFFNQISNRQAGGTIITLLNSLSNCGRLFPRAPAFWLAGLIGPFTTATILAVIGCVQLPFIVTLLDELAHTDTKQDWKLQLQAPELPVFVVPFSSSASSSSSSSQQNGKTR